MRVKLVLAGHMAARTIPARPLVSPTAGSWCRALPQRARVAS